MVEITISPSANDPETLTRGEAFRTVAILSVGLLLKAVTLEEIQDLSA